MKVAVIIEQNSKGRYSAFIDDDRVKFGILGEGNTIEDTIDDFKIGCEEMKETYQSVGKEFPELEFVYKIDKNQTLVNTFRNELSHVSFI